MVAPVALPCELQSEDRVPFGHGVRWLLVSLLLLLVVVLARAGLAVEPLPALEPAVVPPAVPPLLPLLPVELAA